MLGDSFMGAKRVDEAETTFLRLLGLQTERWGQEHEAVRATQRKLGHLYMQSKRLVKSADYFMLALDAPKLDTRPLQEARMLCEMLLLVGENPKSVDLRTALADAQSRTYGETDTRTIHTRAEVAITYARSGDRTSAERAILHLVELVGEEHLETLRCRMWMGVLLSKEEDWEEAHILLDAAYGRAKAKLGPANRLTLQIAGVRARALLNSGKAAQAETFTREILATTTKQAGEQTKTTFDCVILLAAICVELGQHEEANKLASRAIEIQTHLREFLSRNKLGNLGRIIEVLKELRARDFPINEQQLKNALTAATSIAREKGDERLNQWQRLLEQLEQVK